MQLSIIKVFEISRPKSSRFLMQQSETNQQDSRVRTWSISSPLNDSIVFTTSKAYSDSLAENRTISQCFFISYKNSMRWGRCLTNNSIVDDEYSKLTFLVQFEISTSPADTKVSSRSNTRVNLSCFLSLGKSQCFPDFYLFFIKADT